MRERMVVICPTEQAQMHAADWRDGQLAHGVYAGGARRAGGYTKRWSVGRIVIHRLGRHDGGLRRSLSSGRAFARTRWASIRPVPFLAFGVTLTV